MRFLTRGNASFCPTSTVGFALVAFLAVGCGTTATLPDGDVIDLDGIDLNDIDLDGLDVDQDILNQLDIKPDTIGTDTQDVQGPDAADVGGTDATAPDTADTQDIAAGCTSTEACNDGNPCTDDSCGTNGVCLNADNTATCSDGDACTIGDACSAGACLPGAVTGCSDDNVCTDDSCDKVAGCVNLANTATCEDGNACTHDDFCAQGMCLGGGIVSCEDGNGCTIDSCDMALGCTSTISTDPCNDFDSCTNDDMCVDGACTGTLNTCEDGDPCTTNGCNKSTGECEQSYNTAPCDDGNVCTAADHCDNEGTCVGGGPTDCNDSNECTLDYCNDGSTAKNVLLGCVNQPISEAPCSDGNPCTFGDFCGTGVCLAGDPTNCDDENPCTDDSCDMGSGACVNLANAVTCDDGNPCTLADTCTQTECEGVANTCGQGAYDGSNCGTMICDYNDGLCKQTSGVLWNGTFKTAAGWKMTGEWAIGKLIPSTGETFGFGDPNGDWDADGFGAGTVIGGNIDNTPHDWLYLTSPVIDLSTQATATGLYDAVPNLAPYNQSLVLTFEMFIGLSGSAGQYMIVEITGDGQNWTTVANAESDYNDNYWLGSYKLTPTGTDILIPKEMLTKHFQFRFGYKITDMGSVAPIVSGLTVDAPQIGIGNCWD